MSKAAAPEHALSRARTRITRDLAIAAILFGALIALLLNWGDTFVRALLPVQSTVFEALMPEFEVLRLQHDMERADRVLRVKAACRHVVELGGRAYTPDQVGMVDASTLRLQTAFGPLLALWIGLAWPARGRLPEIGRRMVIVLPLGLLLAVVDAPLVLAASIWQLLVDAAAPGTHSPLLLASQFLQGGGRAALGLSIGAASLVLTWHSGKRMGSAAPTSETTSADR